METQNFRLKLELVTPFYLSSALTLDGLLSAAVFNQTGLRGEATLPYIPLEQHAGIFKASALFCEPRYRHESFGYVMSLRSERDLHTRLFQPNKRGKTYGPIDQKRGDYKANMTSYDGIAAREVYFWGVGDPEQTVFLIEHYLTGIGKQGHGEIDTVSYSLTEEDYSWRTAKGQPARPLPVELWRALGGSEQAPVTSLAVRLPYWQTEPVDAVFPTSRTI